MNKVLDFFVQYIKEVIFLMNEMAIYLLIGFLFAGILYAFLPENFVSRHIGAKGFFSSLKASLFGVPLPLCSCGVVPAALSLKKSGASKGATVSFLISTPQTGIDSIAATYSLLGGFFALFRVVFAFITGVIGGVITDFFVKEEEEDFAESSDTGCGCSGSCATEVKNEGFLGKVKTAINYGFGELVESIALWVVLGILIGALISVAVPSSVFELFVSNRLLVYLAILAVSVPLYVCATGSIPIASSLILKGISPGAAFVFLMAGPATNSVTFTVLYKTIGKKAVFIYLTVIVAGSVAGGIIIDAFFADVIAKTVIVKHSAGASFGFLKVFSAILLSLLLFKSLWPVKRQQLSEQTVEESEKNSENSFYSYSVKGMTCNHCKMSVEKAVKETEGVEFFEVDLKSGTLKIKGNFTESELFSKIESKGFEIEKK